MKKNLLSALLIVATVNVFATVLTVSNQSPNPGQYTTIQAAINAATAGDSIYIHPSSVVYAGFSLDRQLTIISSGFEPSSANPNPYAFVNPSVASSINASGSKIIGIYFQNGFGMDVTGLHDFTLSRCILVNIGSRLPINGYNIILTENFFYQFGFSSYNGLGTAHDILISNNVFLVGGTYRPFDNIHGVTNLTVNNNLFYGYNTPLSISGGSGTSGIIFSNNIFNKVAFTSVSGCTFSNCLTYQCTGNTPWINNGTDLGSVALGTQNIANTSPDFVNQASIDAGGYTNVNWFVVNPGSPTLSSMAGDPVMGPYGGSGAYDFRRASASSLPYVYSLTIANPTIQAGSNLTIDVVGKKHD